MTMEQKCAKSGCTGTIIQDVCEDCGRAPPGQSLVAKFASNWKSTLASIKPKNKVETDQLIAELSATDAAESTDSGAHTKARNRGLTRALGAGLVTIDPLPKVDPELLILQNASVPENKRSCGHCGMQFHFMKGFCPKCGREYSLVPTLSAGDTVAGQYEIKGPIAFGGLGWIYLAWDKLLSRHVVLKGLLNSKDEISAAAALQERRYLAAVKHPNIVGIYNFVSHGREGFIVMEFVSGQTIKQIRQEHGPLPVADAIAFVHRILSAFAHLHKIGLLYCDFKPDNFMFEDDDVKLIDMGGVRRIDDSGGDIYGTKGYAAPEATEHPSVSTDLYTIARTLAVLITNFKFQGEFEFSLPDPANELLFQQQESLYLFLLKATRTNASERFQTAESMADQLLGILRETAAEEQTGKHFESTIFESEDVHLHTESDGISLNAVPHGAKAFKLLPALRLDFTDPAAADLARTRSVKELESMIATLDRIAVHHPASVEAPLRAGDVRAQLNMFAASDLRLAQVEKENPSDWRVQWYRGKSFLLKEQPADAKVCFYKVYQELPGEFAPKLALAICAELEATAATISGEEKRAVTIMATAKQYYEKIARSDHTNTPAIFGLARCMLKENNRAGAVTALKKVLPTSSHYSYAQIAIIRALIQPLNELPQQKDLAQAALIIEGLDADGYEKHRLAADTLLVALKVSKNPNFKPEPEKVLGCLMIPKNLCLAAEKELRLCAKHVTNIRMRCRLVDEANKIRPRTIF